MQACRYIASILCWMVLGASTATAAGLWEPGLRKQVATLSNIRVSENDTLAGIRGLRIHYDVRMLYTSDDLAPSGAGTLPYHVVATFFDELGKPVSANPDVVAYKDAAGICVDSASISQGPGQKDFIGQSMFLPYYALPLLPGNRRMQLRLRVHDARNRSLVGESPLQGFNMEMPPLRRFRIHMQRIEVNEKDGKNDSWDYFFFNRKEVLPDVVWSLIRGRNMIIMSEKQRNTTVYEGHSQKDRTRWFTLAQGDQLRLNVQDYDLITFSDLIGGVMLDPWSGEFGSGKESDLAFEQVISARFTMENPPEPRMMISDFEVREGHSESGVTGVQVKFDYRLENEILGTRFRVNLIEYQGDSAKSPRFARVVRGPVEQVGSASFRLTSNSGAVELFIPHYGLVPAGSTGRSLLLMRGEWRLDGQAFAMGGRERELLRKKEPVNDFVFGQWSAGEEIRNGIAGLLFSCEYHVSGRYLSDLQGAVLRLHPEMKMQEGPVPPGYLQRIAPKNARWENDALLLSPEADSSRLDLFMPYYMLPRHLANLQLDLRYHADLSWEGRTSSLGGFELQQEIELPRRLSLQIRVVEVGAKKERQFYADSGLEWRVYQGNMEKYRSRQIPHEKSLLEWRPDEEASLVLTEKDLIRIEVNRVVAGAEPIRLGAWEGRLEDFPREQKGLRKLEVDGLRKLTVEVKEVTE